MWVPLISLIGVLVGGGLTYLTQLTTQRHAARAADHIAEESGPTSAKRDLLDTLWICERMIHVLFSAPVHEHARAYVTALDDVLWGARCHQTRCGTTYGRPKPTSSTPPEPTCPDPGRPQIPDSQDPASG